MIESITEVVDVVPCYRINSIINCTFHCSFPCPCEVCFKSRSSRVENWHLVSVIGPSFSKLIFESWSKSLEWLAWRWICWPHAEKLFVQDESSYHWLYYVSPVKTVHAISSNHSFLLRINLDRRRAKFSLLIKSNFACCHEMSKFIDLGLNLFQ